LVTGITFHSSKRSRVTLTKQKQSHEGLSTNLTSTAENNDIYYYYYYYYYGSTTLCWVLAAFSVSWSYTPSVGLHGGGISPSQGLHTEQHKHRKKKHTIQTSMTRVGFEPRIPVVERTKTVLALDSAATVISIWHLYYHIRKGNNYNNFYEHL
jgi:hypothetical protein